MIYDVIIIGAGAAGLFCGAVMEGDFGDVCKAAEGKSDRIPSSIGHRPPLKGLILEKTSKAGTKLLMSGSGQCNITHAGSIKSFIPCYGKNGSKIRRCLYRYSNTTLMDFLEKGNVRTIEREDGKIFPASMKASDVLELLILRTKKNGFDILYDSPVEQIQQKKQTMDAFKKSNDPLCWQVSASGKHYMAQNLIIASGGCSYPSTGSDGTLLEVLRRDLRVAVISPRPALSSMQVRDYPYGSLSGISFENALVSILRGSKAGIEKMIAKNAGPLLFTHKDLSGPAILNISKYAETGDTLQVNYLYPLTYEQALERLKQASHGTKGSMAGVLASTFDLPKRFCKAITERSGNSLKSMVERLTGETFCISSVSGFNKAMATSGGIDLGQIDTATMAFKEHPGLFAIGEALDVDGITGGYNLQFAYSSACAAAAAIKGRLCGVKGYGTL